MNAVTAAYDAIARARAVLFDGRELEAATLARAAGALVTIDVGSSAKPGIDQLARGCDVVIGPGAAVCAAACASDRTEAAGTLLRAGVRLVVVTAGADGAYATDAQRSWHQPAVPVEVVDSNGAGDAFHGGLVDALLDGADHQAAVRHAATIAAQVIS